MTCGRSAEQHLAAWRGRWLDLSAVDTYPEQLSGEFVRLVMRRPALVLSEAERAVYARLHQVQRLRAAATTHFIAMVAYTPHKSELRLDHKQKCGVCGAFRSLTIIQNGTLLQCEPVTLLASSVFA